ncbi:hypothetical protein, partial [Schaedlerella arabinosiphila]|uniref:hypothetical protein n=1 Tax=Schaedlerella arabinosiphila TaxID=2044587 RepID=UPI002557E47E
YMADVKRKAITQNFYLHPNGKKQVIFARFWSKIQSGIVVQIHLPCKLVTKGGKKDASKFHVYFLYDRKAGEADQAVFG